MAEHLRRGELEVVLPNFPPEAVSLTLLYPNKNLLPARVRLFADFLVERTRLLIERPAAHPVAA